MQKDLFGSTKEETAISPERVNAPLKWHGGKCYVASLALKIMPRHLNYVEPYFGSGQVLFARDPQDKRLWWDKPTSDGRKPDGLSEVINDLHSNLMNFYAVLKDPNTFDALKIRLSLTLHSEDEWKEAKRILAQTDGDPVARAAALFTCCRQSMSGRMDECAVPSRGQARAAGSPSLAAGEGTEARGNDRGRPALIPYLRK